MDEKKLLLEGCVLTKKQAKTKRFNIGTVKMQMHSNGFTKGFILKRELDVKECRYILKNLLGIEVQTKEDCYDSEEYKDYNGELRYNVNRWLKGEFDDEIIMEYAHDCSDEHLGMMNLIPIICYLKKRDIID